MGAVSEQRRAAAPAGTALKGKEVFYMLAQMRKTRSGLIRFFNANAYNAKSGNPRWATLAQGSPPVLINILEVINGALLSAYGHSACKVQWKTSPSICTIRQHALPSPPRL